MRGIIFVFKNITMESIETWRIDGKLEALDDLCKKGSCGGLTVPSGQNVFDFMNMAVKVTNDPIHHSKELGSTHGRHPEAYGTMLYSIVSFPDQAEEDFEEIIQKYSSSDLIVISINDVYVHAITQYIEMLHEDWLIGCIFDTPYPFHFASTLQNRLPQSFEIHQYSSYNALPFTMYLRNHTRRDTVHQIDFPQMLKGSLGYLSITDLLPMISSKLNLKKKYGA